MVGQQTSAIHAEVGMQRRQACIRVVISGGGHAVGELRYDQRPACNIAVGETDVLISYDRRQPCMEQLSWGLICSGAVKTKGRHVMEQLFLEGDMHRGSYDQGQPCNGAVIPGGRYAMEQ